MRKNHRPPGPEPLKFTKAHLCRQFLNGVLHTNSTQLEACVPLPEPIHPGRILEGVLADVGLSANAVALALLIPTIRLTAIINGKRSLSADTALRLARYFGTSAQMWMNLQAKYDLDTAEDALAGRLANEVQPMRKAS